MLLICFSNVVSLTRCNYQIQTSLNFFSSQSCESKIASFKGLHGHLTVYSLALTIYLSFSRFRHTLIIFSGAKKTKKA
jgi:hypothetical protein